MQSQPLIIHYHRDFDGMVAAAVLAQTLRRTRGEAPRWRSVNYDQREDWLGFGLDTRFAVVDFHFHPRAEYWFDHHPTTFLSPQLREQYAPSDRWLWDPASPSCPPLILGHAKQRWGYQPTPEFEEMARWSDVIDAARYKSVDEAVFGDAPALRIARALTAAPSEDWSDWLVDQLTERSLEDVAASSEVERAYERAARNRDKALIQFPPTVRSREGRVLCYDASSHAIRRERFAPFYHHPEIHYAVGVIPTRSGFHVSAGENPWRPSPADVHIGELMERHGGGGHKSVGGANPVDLPAARELADAIARALREALGGRA
jgi:hypothetical protein